MGRTSTEEIGVIADDSAPDYRLPWRLFQERWPEIGEWEWRKARGNAPNAAERRVALAREQPDRPQTV